MNRAASTPYPTVLLLLLLVMPALPRNSDRTQAGNSKLAATVVAGGMSNETSNDQRGRPLEPRQRFRYLLSADIHDKPVVRSLKCAIVPREESLNPVVAGFPDGTSDTLGTTAWCKISVLRIARQHSQQQYGNRDRHLHPLWSDLARLDESS